MSCLESFRPSSSRGRPDSAHFAGRMAAAATTGPASGPRPASSTPATRVIPRFHNARSNSKRSIKLPGPSLIREPSAFRRVVSLILFEAEIGTRNFAIEDSHENPCSSAVHPWLNFRHENRSPPHRHEGAPSAVRHWRQSKPFPKPRRKSFLSDGKHAVAPEPSGLEPAEPQMSASGLNLPLKQFVEQTVAATLDKLGLEKPDVVD